MTKETLESAAEIPVEITSTQLAEPKKHRRHRLMEYLGRDIVCLQTHVTTASEKASLLRVQSLEGQRV